MTCKNDTPKKITAATIVILYKILSKPLFELYTLLDPPKAAPKPAPFCCINTTIISKIAKTIWMIVKIPNILLFLYAYLCILQYIILRSKRQAKPLIRTIVAK